MRTNVHGAPSMHRCQVKRGRKERTGLNRAWGVFKLRGNDRNGVEPGGRGKVRMYRIKWLPYDRTLSESDRMGTGKPITNACAG